MDLGIKTMLGARSRGPLLGSRLFIKRGATAVLTYNLNGLYDFDYVDQLTFSFSYGVKVFGYDMFIYMVESDDTEPADGKTYYSDFEIIDADRRECKAKLVDDPSGSPAAQGWYEKIGLNENDSAWWMQDEHFEYDSLCDCVNFSFSSEETSKLIAGESMSYEVALRFNQSDELSKESVIINAPTPVAIVDSLFVNAARRNDLVASDDQFSLASVGVTVTE